MTSLRIDGRTPDPVTLYWLKQNHNQTTPMIDHLDSRIHLVEGYAFVAK